MYGWIIKSLFLLKEGFYLACKFSLFLSCDIYEKRTRDTDRWVCSDDTSEYESECKSFETTWPKYKECDKYDDNCKRSEKGTTQSIMDGFIDELTEWEFFHGTILEIWSDSIHNYDSVIDRVAKDCQHRSDKKCIYLKFRKKVWSDDIESKSDHYIMNEGYSGYNREWIWCHTSNRSTKSILDIERDGKYCKSESDISRFFDICTKWCPDIDISSLFYGCILYFWELHSECLHKCCFRLFYCFYISSFLVYSCFDDETISSRYSVYERIGDNVFFFCWEAYFRCFDDTCFCFCYDFICCYSSDLVLYLDSTSHIDTQIEFHDKWENDGYYEKSNCNCIKCKSIFCKRKHRKEGL